MLTFCPHRASNQQYGKQGNRFHGVMAPFGLCSVSYIRYWAAVGFCYSSARMAGTNPGEEIKQRNDDGQRQKCHPRNSGRWFYLDLIGHVLRQIKQGLFRLAGLQDQKDRSTPLA